MLVEPSLDELLTKVDSKFKLVTLALKRARQINDGGTENEKYNAAKPVSTALREIADDQVFVAEGTDEDDEPAARNDAAASEFDDIGLAGLEPESLSLAMQLGEDTAEAPSIEDMVAGDEEDEEEDDSADMNLFIQEDNEPGTDVLDSLKEEE